MFIKVVFLDELLRFFIGGFLGFILELGCFVIVVLSSGMFEFIKEFDENGGCLIYVIG